VELGYKAHQNQLQECP